MATQTHRLTNVPTDIVAALSLAIGTTYSGQYVGSSPLRYIEASTAPDANDITNVALPYESIIIIPKSGEQVYVWSRDGGGHLVLNEVP